MELTSSFTAEPQPLQVIIVLAVLGALSLAESSPSELVNHPLGRFCLALGVAALPVLAAWQLSKSTLSNLNQPGRNHLQVLKKFNRLRKAHTILWLLSAGCVLLGLDWAQLVRFNLDLDGWVLLDELLIVAPVLLPLVGSWAAFYDVDRVVRTALADAEDGETPADLPPRWTLVAFQVRTVMGIALAPLLLLLATQDIARLTAPQFMQSPHAWTVLLLPLLILVAGFPVLLRHIWKTEPLPAGPLRQRLELAAARFQLRVRDILVWKTDGLLLNAAVAGFVPCWRYVFLTDALLEQMTDDEIEAVFGHEVGHIRHRHVFLRALVLLAPLSCWSLLQAVWPGLTPQSEAFESLGWIATGLAGLVLLVLLGLYIAAVFGYCSRRFERQADLFGCRVSSAGLTERGADATNNVGSLSPEGIETFIHALEKLAVLNGVSRRSPSWQHSSIALRVAYLEAVANDPQSESHCHGQVKSLGRLLVCLAICGVLTPILLAVVNR